MTILFSPEEVSAALEELPHLRSLIGPPEREGIGSDAFPSMRTTDRQVYRVLSNDHYPHLKALLKSLDYCIGKGFIPPHLVKTRGRAQFESLLAEARVAEKLFRREFTIEGLDDTKGERVVPEFVARRMESSIAVEVYAPRSTEGLDLLTDELIDQLKNLDVALDFRFEIRVDQLNHFDTSSRLLSLHPQVLAEGLTKAVRDETIKALLKDLDERLKNGDRKCSTVHELPSLNIKVEVTVSEARLATGPTPARLGVISHAPLSGYAPEAMAEAFVKGGLTRKLKRGQGPKSGVAPISILFVDLSHAREIAQETEFDPTAFVRVLEENLPDDLGGYDALAVTTSAVADGEGRLLFVATQDQNDEAAILLRDLYQ